MVVFPNQYGRLLYNQQKMHAGLLRTAPVIYASSKIIDKRWPSKTNRYVINSANTRLAQGLKCEKSGCRRVL